VGDFELLLCHGTVCVVGKIRDLILQLSKSSIYSTKPLNTLNKMAESFGFTDNPRYIAEKNYMEALLKKASPHTVR
ncbi:hypothetical protein K9T74_00610, partial [Escherichia coli]|nr:hypothetical protein [Escherichia coli]